MVQCSECLVPCGENGSTADVNDGSEGVFTLGDAKGHSVKEVGESAGVWKQGVWSYGSTSSGKNPSLQETLLRIVQGRHPPNLSQLLNSLM